MDESDSAAAELTRAIKGGDVAALRQLLAGRPGLAAESIRGRNGGTRTPWHLVADWPGYFPEGPAVAGMLIEAGADPNARTGGGRSPETPLHWAASSDDADVADALISGGADVDPDGGAADGRSCSGGHHGGVLAGLPRRAAARG